MTKRNKDVAKGWDIFHWEWLKNPSVNFSAFIHVVGFFVGIAVIILALAILYHVAATAVSFNVSENSKPDEVIRNLLLSLAALIGAPFLVWRTYIASKQTKTSEEKTEIDRQTHYTTLYTKSIELLGAMRVIKDDESKDVSEPAMELRLGAIYALERIARDSWKDHWPIMEVLTAYIRENSPYKDADNPEPITTDIQAAITVIGRRNLIWIAKEKEVNKRIDLQNCNLHSANFGSETDYADTIFDKSCLINCSFNRSNLKNAQFPYILSDRLHFGYSDLTNPLLHNMSLKSIGILQCNCTNISLHQEKKYKNYSLTIYSSIILHSHFISGDPLRIEDSLVDDKSLLNKSYKFKNEFIDSNSLNHEQTEHMFSRLISIPAIEGGWPTLIEEAKKQS